MTLTSAAAHVPWVRPTGRPLAAALATRNMPGVHVGALYYSCRFAVSA
jgi:hypothetical protein